MKSILWRVVLAVLVLTSCSNGSHAPFLLADEKPVLNTILNDVDGAADITLEITNKSGVVKLLNVGGNPSELTEIDESFYTNFCHEKVLVIVVRQYITSIDSYGWLVYNVIVNTKDGSLVKVIETALFKDNETDRVSFDSQTRVLSTLKSGKTLDTVCESTEKYISDNISK